MTYSIEVLGSFPLAFLFPGASGGELENTGRPSVIAARRPYFIVYSGFLLPLVSDENKTSTGKSKIPAIVTLAN
jgi:hypothetical protein